MVVLRRRRQRNPAGFRRPDERSDYRLNPRDRRGKQRRSNSKYAVGGRVVRESTRGSEGEGCKDQGSGRKGKGGERGGQGLEGGRNRARRRERSVCIKNQAGSARAA